MGTKQLPSLFMDDSNTDQFEILCDCFISWTLRCAESTYTFEEKLHRYAQRIMALFIGENPDEFENKTIKSVKTIRQEKHKTIIKKFGQDAEIASLDEKSSIDIVISMEIEESPYEYIIIIEDKYGGKFKDKQIERYKKTLRSLKSNKKIQSFCVFVRWGNINSTVSEKEIYNKKEECFLYLDWADFSKALEIKNFEKIDLNKLTNNRLFDEFWFYWSYDTIKRESGNKKDKE